MLSSASFTLTKIKLQALNITDVSLAVIGHYGKAVTDLSLISLPNVSEKGFWVMGNGHGLQKLKSFAVTSCRGVTDLGLEAVGKGCPNLKQLCLHKCAFLSDKGLVSFAKTASSLESLQLEECHRITQFGFFGSLLNCGAKLKAFSLVNCYGIKDLNLGLPSVLPCKSLRSLSIRNCPGFGDASLAALGKLCPQLEHVELSGLHGISDAGFLPLLETREADLVKVNLSGCVNLSDKAVCIMADLHGWTLEMLNLEALARSNQIKLQILSMSGCSKVSDKSMPSLLKLGQTLLGLNLQQCKAISSSAVDLLVEQLWRFPFIKDLLLDFESR
ncbi:hypothetical protein V6Z11_A13G214400 [Gossypium hirsutum]